MGWQVDVLCSPVLSQLNTVKTETDLHWLGPAVTDGIFHGRLAFFGSFRDKLAAVC